MHTPEDSLGFTFAAFHIMLKALKPLNFLNCRPLNFNEGPGIPTLHYTISSTQGRKRNIEKNINNTILWVEFAPGKVGSCPRSRSVVPLGQLRGGLEVPWQFFSSLAFPAQFITS